MKHILLFISLSISIGQLCSIQAQEIQKNIDSLVQELQRVQVDTSKVLLYQKIAGHYNVTHIDSAKAYAEAGVNLAKQLGYEKGTWLCLNVLGNYYERKTQYDSARVKYNEALVLVEKTNSTQGYAIVLNNIATLHIRQGEYQKAIPLLFRALEAEEELENINGVAQAYNNIGVVYYYAQDFDKTTHYLTKALQIQEELGNFDGLINGYNNVGAIQDYQKKYDEAIVSYTKGLQISRQINDSKNESIQLINIALAHSKNNNFKEAERFFDESIALKRDIEDTNGLAHAYTTFGSALLDQKKYKEAASYLTEGIAIAEQNKLKLYQKEGLASLAQLHKETGNFKEASQILEEYIVVKDSLLNETNSKIIAEVETKYETQKKETEIERQRATIAEQELVVKKKNTLILGALGLVVTAIIIGYLVYSQQKLKNKQIQKEAELKTALAKIETQNKLQEQRLRISRDLHDNIGSQLTFIISSIDNVKYAFKELPEALHNKLNTISRFTTQTIYELRDTIWAMNKTKITYEDLQARITNFIDQAKQVSETQVDFQSSVQADSTISFASIQGMNMYRIIQEAVNNALKYADASQINLSMKQENDTIAFSISDNGKGFNVDTIQGGNGLQNMKKRARDLNGTIEINATEGGGTKILVQFKLV